MNNGNFPLKVRLAIMSFLEFAVWGAYLTSLGNYLGRVGLANDIKWFYAIQGIVSIFMPAIIGIVADRWIHAQRMLSLSHLIAGIFMGAAGIYSMMAGDHVEFHTLFWFYAVSVAFFMPTIGLSNSVAYSALTKAGLDTVKEFPPIRVFGTIGFICAMLFVNFTQYQTNYCQLITSAILSGVLCIYALTLPDCPTNKAASNSISDMLGLKAFSLFKQKKMAIFFIFSMLLGVSLQITNGYGNVFITSFKEVAEFANTWGAQNANALISLSQMSETLCILMIPFFLKRIGIKGMMLMSMFAWVGRFGFFGIGNPGELVWLFILSMIVYGIAFDFFNVSGSLYVDQETDPSIRSSAQGLFMIMTNGLGATIGTLSAGAILEKLVFTQPAGTAQIDGWHTSWLIFAAYAFVVGVLFAIIFKENRKENISKSQAADKNGLAAGGIIDDKDQI
ncbi:MAG: MFS transporter [Muribaculaceae bacterium]|nr:MFS transporter [Muribaculaceae bacterium]MDE6523489.1 MFS transporter [Muribaculaceae bacterium]